MIWRSWLLFGFGSLVLLGLWELAVIQYRISDLLLPAPSAVAAAIVTKAPVYMRHMVPSVVELAAGYGLAVVLGGLVGVLVGLSPTVGRGVYPALIIMQIVPKVAFAPLLVVWFGFGITPKLILIALIAFFPVLINTVVALNMTTRESAYLFRSMGAGGLQTFFKLRLPTAMPVFFGGLKVASTLAVVGLVVAEFYSADAGLGYLLLLTISNGDTTSAFGAIAYITALGLVLFGLIVLLELWVVPAHMRKRIDG